MFHIQSISINSLYFTSRFIWFVEIFSHIRMAYIATERYLVIKCFFCCYYCSKKKKNCTQSINTHGGLVSFRLYGVIQFTWYCPVSDYAVNLPHNFGSFRSLENITRAHNNNNNHIHKSIEFNVGQFNIAAPIFAKEFLMAIICSPFVSFFLTIAYDFGNTKRVVAFPTKKAISFSPSHSMSLLDCFFFIGSFHIHFNEKGHKTNFESIWQFPFKIKYSICHRTMVDCLARVNEAWKAKRKTQQHSVRSHFFCFINSVIVFFLFIHTWWLCVFLSNNNRENKTRGEHKDIFKLNRYVIQMEWKHPCIVSWQLYTISLAFKWSGPNKSHINIRKTKEKNACLYDKCILIISVFFARPLSLYVSTASTLNAILCKQ